MPVSQRRNNRTVLTVKLLLRLDTLNSWKASLTLATHGQHRKKNGIYKFATCRTSIVVNGGEDMRQQSI